MVAFFHGRDRIRNRPVERRGHRLGATLRRIGARAGLALPTMGRFRGAEAVLMRAYRTQFAALDAYGRLSDPAVHGYEVFWELYDPRRSREKPDPLRPVLLAAAESQR